MSRSSDELDHRRYEWYIFQNEHESLPGQAFISSSPSLLQITCVRSPPREKPFFLFSLIIESFLSSHKNSSAQLNFKLINRETIASPSIFIVAFGGSSNGVLISYRRLHSCSVRFIAFGSGRSSHDNLTTQHMARPTKSMLHRSQS